MINALAIPTYDNQKTVMFYDVLMSLCHQAIKLYFLQDTGVIKKIKIRLRTMRAFGGKILYSDKLECIHYKNSTRKNQYDMSIIELIEVEMKKETPAAELVQKLVELNKEMKKEYNHVVDTNHKVIGKENFAKTTNLLKLAKFELYTTRHLISGNLIYNFVSEYIDRRTNRT